MLGIKENLWHRFLPTQVLHLLLSAGMVCDIDFNILYMASLQQILHALRSSVPALRINKDASHSLLLLLLCVMSLNFFCLLLLPS